MEGFRLLGKDSEWRRGLKTGVVGKWVGGKEGGGWGGVGFSGQYH